MFYSGHCPPRLEWRLRANETDPRVLSSRKTVHNGIAASVILDESIEESEHSRLVCSLIINSEDRTSDLKIQDCSKHRKFNYFHVDMREDSMDIEIDLLLGFKMEILNSNLGGPHLSENDCIICVT